jgi:hypothetical protein
LFLHEFTVGAAPVQAPAVHANKKSGDDTMEIRKRLTHAITLSAIFTGLRARAGAEQGIS